MRIRIDTEEKTISLDEAVNIGELLDRLKEWFSEEDLRSFKLEVKQEINWNPNPIIIERGPSIFPPYRQPWYEQPYITYNDSAPHSNTMENNTSMEYSHRTLRKGTFDVELL